MTPKTCRKLLDNGVLEAYAQGKKIEYKINSHSNWDSGDEWSFDGNHEAYRIKPSPTPERGMYLRQSNEYRMITSVSNSKVYVTLEGLRDSVSIKESTLHRRILTPFTFEQAVKAVAENGFALAKGSEFYTIISFNDEGCWIHSSRTQLPLWYNYKDLTSANFPKGIPFANVTYEEVTE